MASESGERAHEELAAELAEDFASGDDATRDSVARQCEEQGIVAVLVADVLRERGLHRELVEAMKGFLSRFGRR